MRTFVILLFCSALAGAQDARAIVLRSLDLDSRNEKLARNYTFVQRNVAREFSSGGKPKKVRIETYDVTLLEGSPYGRLIARDDKPLPPAEEQKQQQKLRQSVEERRRETPEQRANRIAKWEKGRRESREPLLEIPDAFDLRIAGEELADGRPAWVIEAAPRPGYRGKTRISRLFPKFKGRLWIDKQDSVWVRTEAETLDTISFGLFLARLQKGMRLRFEQTHVNGEVWLPKRFDLSLSVRVALVKAARVNLEVAYSGYRKFQAESRVVAFDPKQ